jgi:peroxiredoxin
MSLQVGAPAPDFTLKTLTSEGLQDVSLSEAQGKEHTVLLFFPAAFTGVCTQQLCDATGGIQAYKSMNARVLGISADTPFAQAAWAEKESISIPLLSDYQKEVIDAYGVTLDDLAGLGKGSKRAAVVVDKEGVIRHIEITAPTDMPSVEAVHAALAQLQ